MSRGGGVIVIGSRATVAVVGFRVLRELGIPVPLVIAGSEDPGTDDWRLSLAKAARDAGYRDGENLLTVGNPHDNATIDRVRAAEADLVLSLQWRRILRPPLLTIPRFGVVNLHNAPLPLLRGCDPFSWAIHDGLERMGVSLHQVIDEGMDSGPVLSQRLWPVTPTATAWSLYLEAQREAEMLMRETLPEIAAGRLAPRAQDPRYASYHPIGQFRFHDLEADWKLPAITLSAALRSRIFVPFQVPFFFCRGERIEILACRAVEGRGAPASIAAIEPLRIGTKYGLLELIEVRAQGRAISGAEFARSAGFRPGDTLS